AFYRHHLDELVRVITRVLCPSSSSHTTDRSTDLSDREYEVLRLIASGHRLSEIARKLSLSANTVSTYRARMLGKLKMRTNAQLTLRNYDARWLFVQRAAHHPQIILRVEAEDFRPDIVRMRELQRVAGQELFARLPEDKHDPAPFVQELPHPHPKVAAGRIGEKDAPAVHAFHDREMLVAQRLDEHDHRRGELGQLARR